MDEYKLLITLRMLWFCRQCVPEAASDRLHGGHYTWSFDSGPHTMWYAPRLCMKAKLSHDREIGTGMTM